MKGIVINPFRDKYHFNTGYEVGDVVDFERTRMEDLISRGLCKKYEEQEETPAPLKDEQEASVPSKEEEETTSVDEAKEKSEQEAAEKIAKATRRKRTI